MPQSPVSETPPVTDIDPPEAPNLQPSDYVRIAKAYPKFQAYIEMVIAKYQQFHPSGTPIEGIPEAERMKWWGAASCIVREFEALRKHVAAETRPKK